MRSPVDSLATDGLRCEDVALRLPAILDGHADASPSTVAHIEACLRCQVELSRYRRLVGLLAKLRDDEVSLPSGALAEILTDVRHAARRRMIRSALGRRQVAYTTGVLVVGALAVVIGVLRARPAPFRRA